MQSNYCVLVLQAVLFGRSVLVSVNPRLTSSCGYESIPEGSTDFPELEDIDPSDLVEKELICC